MHIKQVIIQGFKSYREQTIFEPFDQRHNVIVGSNGTGKSNFFHAIQFVLSDEYFRMSSDQLQSLLHEGIGPRVVSAYVEIIFDNSDGRIPIDKAEVCLRRSFGSKKDQYFLNKKIVARTEVLNLFETAGFSKSNPYYIVKQGKINELAIASESFRLKLLREIAGTQTYEKKASDSKKLLKDTDVLLSRFEEMLSIIDKRMIDLEEEVEELKAFQELDVHRRTLEFVIYNKEVKDDKSKLIAIQDELDSRRELQLELAKKYEDARVAVRAAVESVKDAKRAVRFAKDEQETINVEQQELLKNKIKLLLTIKDLTEEVSRDVDNREKAQVELEDLKIDIAKAEEELEIVKPQYEETKNLEEQCARELSVKEQKCKELYAKVGRFCQYKNKEERDEWINSELQKLKQQIKNSEDHKAKFVEDMRIDCEKQISLKEKIEDLNTKIKGETDSIDNRNKSLDEIIKAKDECQALRKEQYRKESILENQISGLREDLTKADHKLRSLVDSSILNGRDSVQKTVAAFEEQSSSESESTEDGQNRTGYHGLLVDNFFCDTPMYTAVEVAAGNSLFNHVIDRDGFSTKIFKEINRLNLPGSATFMPLNRISVKPQQYPVNTRDAIPIIAKLVYSPKFDKAIRYVFGRTLVCRNLEVATQLARDTHFNCVTMDGDQASATGALTGGFYNKSRSRLEAHKSRSNIIKEINELYKDLEVLKNQTTETDHNIVSYVTQLTKAETKNNRAKNIIDKLHADLRITKAELLNTERSQASKDRCLARCVLSIETTTATKEGLESELEQELEAQLSQEERQLADSLNDDTRRLTKQNKELFAKRMGLEAEKNKLENLLANNLMRRRDELVQALQEISFEDRQKKLQALKIQLKKVKTRIIETNTEFENVGEKVSIAVQKQNEEIVELERSKSFEKEEKVNCEVFATEIGTYLNRIHILEENLKNSQRKLADVEALPNHEKLDEYSKFTRQQLLKEAEATFKKLKKFSRVNKKALDQFNSFTDDKENLIHRKQELDVGKEKIIELMLVLEQRKYEAIEFTFKQVSIFFKEIFQKLVPYGDADLVMLAAEGEAEYDADSTTSDHFVGVGIKVSFTEQAAERQGMNQLSGGQKSLVALALIFAIQKCDPAPFYLFDEIDQALDSDHRAAVASMIHELSADAQFITTTFRAELLKHANKFYGIKYRNKVSHVDCVTLKEAEDFVRDADLSFD